MPKILIISNNEICYNARLLKAADFFHDKGWNVTVFNSITGIASEEVYKKTIEKRSWKVIESNISKRTFSSKVKWLYSSVIHKLTHTLNNKFGWRVGEAHYLNKGLLLFPELNQSYDLILIHLVDSLPFAAKLKNKLNARLIYDSQEYFVGQYAAFDKNAYEWVKRNEQKYIKEVDVLLTTTEVMRHQIIKDYQLEIPSFRVRNVPTKQQVAEKIEKENVQEESLQLVWHGMSIYFNNRRGVHILLQAIAECKENVCLILQGNFPSDQQAILDEYCSRLNLKGKIMIKPAADPDNIVKSLTTYDVGLTGELPEEMNQELTSSNKLFDYIHAGLAVISSDALGLAETIDEFDVGLKYEPGNVAELSKKIDILAKDRSSLQKYKINSRRASKSLYWEDDYIKVLNYLEQ